MKKNQYQNNKILTIGIPVRNEEKALPHFLHSFVPAIKQFKLLAEIIFCVNGSTDKSLDIIQSFKRRFNALNIRIIESSDGKMQAQQHIIHSSHFNGPIAFLDADIVLDQNCLQKLWETLESNKSLQVAFAKVHPNSSHSGRHSFATTREHADKKLSRRCVLNKVRMYFELNPDDQ